MRKKINPEETVSISFEFILTIQQEVQFSVLRPLSTKFASTLILCYTYLAALLYSGNREEVSNMSSLFNSFLVTVGANVVSYYICKWLDSYRKGK